MTLIRLTLKSTDTAIRSLYLLIIKKIYYVSCYDIIMELRELSKLSEDYIAEMLTNLGLLMR